MHVCCKNSALVSQLVCEYFATRPPEAAPRSRTRPWGGSSEQCSSSSEPSPPSRQQFGSRGKINSAIVFAVLPSQQFALISANKAPVTWFKFKIGHICTSQDAPQQPHRLTSIVWSLGSQDWKVQLYTSLIQLTLNRFFRLPNNAILIQFQKLPIPIVGQLSTYVIRIKRSDIHNLHGLSG